MTELNDLTAVEQRRLLRDREVSAGELLTAHLARIDATNPGVNAIIALDPEVGRRRARAIDDAIASGAPVGPLAGLVVAHKDLTETADFPTTYGSPLFAGFRPPADSVVVDRMRRAGAVAVGKTNVPEFGAGSHTFNPVHGATRNPWDPTRTAGGSSGGAAVALSCGMIALADGSDMGGSLRNPAAWNNVIGLRPSARVVPHVGPGNAWLPLSIAGPMGRCVDDVLLLLGVLTPGDRRDPLHRSIDVPDRIEPVDRPLRVAWSKDLGGLPIENGQRDVLEMFRATVDSVGWTVDDDEPDFAGADECFVVLRAWGFANGPTGGLGRRLESVKATVQDEVRRGRALSADAVAVAYEHLGVLWRRSAAFFARYDLLVAPVTQLAPFPIEWEYPTRIEDRQLSTYIEWMSACCRVSVLGNPAMSVPAGFDADGLPVGVQLIGPHFGDVGLLRAAAVLEASTGHGRRRPPAV